MVRKKSMHVCPCNGEHEHFFLGLVVLGFFSLMFFLMFMDVTEDAVSLENAICGERYDMVMGANDNVFVDWYHNPIACVNKSVVPVERYDGETVMIVQGGS